MRYKSFIFASVILLSNSPVSSALAPGLSGPAHAGGYVAPFIEMMPATPPPAAPAGFTLCNEPAICAGLALAILAFLVSSGGKGSDGHVVPPAPEPPKPPVKPPGPPEVPPEVAPIPVPATAPLLLGGLSVMGAIRYRKSRREASVQPKGAARDER